MKNNRSFLTLLLFLAVTKELTTALELAARSASSKKALQTNTFTWSSIVLKCGRIYPELFSNGGNSNNGDNHRASTAIGNWLEAPKAIEGPQSQSNLRPKSSPLERKVLSMPPPQVPEKVEEINEDNEETKAELQSAPPPEAERLNYGLIQRHVTVELGRRQSLLLLQALRWLLTRSNNGQRKVFLNSYLRSDILGLKVSTNNKNNDHPNPVMQLIDAQTILANPQAMFQQSVVRLMNAMASIKSGRDYLGNYKNVVGVLINSLIEVSSMDQFTIDMIVATLQKLSLKYLVRRQLIESGMLEWLIDHLKQFVRNENHLSCYGLEYSTALFMNLCLHRSGKLRCLPMAQEVLNTFLQLLSSSNKRQILPYVNGTLYSLLTNPKIAATARQLQFSEKLKLAIAATANDVNHEDFESDEEARQQISFVLQQYEESSNSSSSSSSSENSSIASSTTMSSLSDDGYEEDEESNDEDVDIEDEVDLYDPVVAKDNELSGNALLCAYYLLENSDQERPESNECNLETDPKTERILEEELESSSSSSTKSSNIRSTTNTRKTSSSEGNESPRAREPCSFFISTSPPLPASLKPQLSSEISSISTETTSSSTEEPTVKEKEVEVEVEAKQATPKVQPEVTNKTNSSDTDEGVVLVMEDRLEPPKAPVKRPKQTKYRSKSTSRKSSTSSSSAGSTGKTNSRQHSAAKVSIAGNLPLKMR